MSELTSPARNTRSRSAQGGNTQQEPPTRQQGKSKRKTPVPEPDPHATDSGSTANGSSSVATPPSTPTRQGDSSNTAQGNQTRVEETATIQNIPNLENSAGSQTAAGVSSPPPQGSQTSSGTSVGSSTDSVNVTSVRNTGGSSVNRSAEQSTSDRQAGTTQGVVIPQYPTPPSHNNSQNDDMNKAYDRARRSVTERFSRETADPEAWLNFMRWTASTNKLDHEARKKLIWECLSESIQKIYSVAHEVRKSSYDNIVEWFEESFVVKRSTVEIMRDIEELTWDHENVPFSRFLIDFVSAMGLLANNDFRQRMWLLQGKLPGYLGQMCQAEFPRFTCFADMTSWVNSHENFKLYAALTPLKPANNNNQPVNAVSDTLQNVQTGALNPNLEVLQKVDQLADSIQLVVNALNSYQRGGLPRNRYYGSRGGRGKRGGRGGWSNDRDRSSKSHYDSKRGDNPAKHRSDNRYDGKGDNRRDRMDESDDSETQESKRSGSKPNANRKRKRDD